MSSWNHCVIQSTFRTSLLSPSLIEAHLLYEANHSIMASTGGRRALRSASRQTTTSSGNAASTTSGGQRQPISTSRSISRSSRASPSTRSRCSTEGGVALSSSTGWTEATSNTSVSSVERPKTDLEGTNPVSRTHRSLTSTHAEKSSDLSGDAWVTEQILSKLKRHVTHLFDTFCIVDLQSYGHPTVATSTDLLSTGCSVEAEPHFIHGEWLGKSWQITSEEYGDGRHKYRVTLGGDLHDPMYEPSKAQKRFYGHLDLTNLVRAVRRSQGDVRTSEDPPPDIWLALAIEEMDALGIRIRRRPKPGVSKRVFRKDQLDLAMDLIRGIHKDYFVLEPCNDEDACEITYTSPSLLESYGSGSQPADLFELLEHIRTGKKFYCDVTWDGPKIAYCIPMKGQYVNCWLCFLVDINLLAIW